MHFTKNIWFVIIFVLSNIVVRYGGAVQFNSVVYDKNHWVMENIFEIKKRLSNLGLSLEENLPRAKNVILFIGDGMGLNTLTSARIFKGQRNQRSGEMEKLIWDEFPSLAHVKVIYFLIFNHCSHLSRTNSIFSSGICSRLIQSRFTNS